MRGLTKIGRTRLLKVKEQILAKPQYFDMATYCIKGPCGTFACIGGQLLINAGVPLREIIEHASACTPRAGKLLGLTGKRAWPLFHLRGWPSDLLDEYYAGHAGYRATAAAEAIDRFIAGDGSFATAADTTGD